ncbi:hypothetical protein CP061683_0486, partial [Chlamydia psittaci 06-1683]
FNKVFFCSQAIGETLTFCIQGVKLCKKFFVIKTKSEY